MNLVIISSNKDLWVRAVFFLFLFENYSLKLIRITKLLSNNVLKFN